MVITNSVDQIDVKGREILTSGTADFPIAFFEIIRTTLLVSGTVCRKSSGRSWIIRNCLKPTTLLSIFST